MCWSLSILLVLLLLVPTSCNSSGLLPFESSSAPGVTVTDTATIVFTSTLTPTSTATRTPTITPTPTPVAIRDSAWTDKVVASVCLDVKLTYLDLPDGLSLPVESTVREILQGMSIEVLHSGEDCDAMLQIVLTVQPEWEVYVFSDGDESSCNTGGRIQGRVSISARDRDAIDIHLYHVYTPDYIMDCPQTPSLSPGYWSYVWDDPIISGIIRIWGPRAAAVVIDMGAHWDIAVRSLAGMEEDVSEALPQLIRVLEAEKTTHENKSYAAEALAKNGYQASEAIPVLIQELNKTLTKIIEVGIESPSVSRDIDLRNDLSGALFRLTRAPCNRLSDFTNEEVQCWQVWWETQLVVEDEDVQMLIRSALGATDPVERWNAILGLGRLEQINEGVVDTLIASTRDAHPDVRAAAIRVLGEVDPVTDESIRALIAALMDEEQGGLFSGYLHFDAAEALAQIGMPAVPALIEKVSENFNDPAEYPTKHSERAFDTLLRITDLREYYESFDITRTGMVVDAELKNAAMEAVVEASWAMYEEYVEQMES